MACRRTRHQEREEVKASGLRSFQLATEVKNTDLRGSKNASKTNRKPDLYSEGARLYAVVPLDGLLLPLVVRDVPRELEHGATTKHTRGDYTGFAPLVTGGHLKPSF